MPGREQQLAHTRHRPEDRQAIGARRPQADPDLVQARVPEPGCHPQRLGQHLPDALGRGLRAKAGAGLAGRADHDPATRPRHDVVAATPGYDRPRPGLGPGQPQVDDLAALGRHRKLDAERGPERLGPGAGRDHELAAGDRPGSERHALNRAGADDQPLDARALQGQPARLGRPPERRHQQAAIDPRAGRRVQGAPDPRERREHRARALGADLGMRADAAPSGPQPVRALLLERPELVGVQRHGQRAGDAIAGIAGGLGGERCDQLGVVQHRARREALHRVRIIECGARGQDPGAGGARPARIAAIEQQRAHTVCDQVVGGRHADHTAADHDRVVAGHDRRAQSVCS